MGALFTKHAAKSITIRLPLPPSVNSYWTSFVPAGKSRAVINVSHEGHAFRKSIRVLWPEWTPLTGRLRLTVTFSMGRRGRADLDNRLKSLLDALKPNRDKGFDGAYLDDSQVDELHVFRGPVAPPAGHCDLILEAIPE